MTDVWSSCLYGNMLLVVTMLMMWPFRVQSLCAPPPHEGPLVPQR